ncbi:MetQ/NlpA family ABC transporter substrate-binding protein [Nocardia pneumoniae]|uniref:MetQ/NlpA family ABC transporter substrate-binding protein n=1 Tax=Nocardia pneumoniae TaxID=228601 RepID=UPI001FE0D5F6|nr:MetQ/NlpA family ABC transporter substrate-binding protein [Nocardia pneumoniae]
MSVLAFAVVGCGGADRPDVVRIGVNDLSLPHWEVYRKKAAEHGITVEFTNFTDYNQPNPALAQGRIDLNKFQHVRYLANYNVRNVGLAQFYHDPDVEAAVRAETGYRGIFKTNASADLQATLTELEARFRK